MVRSNGYEAAKQRAAAIDRAERGSLVVSGADRASYLQGLLTNDINALNAGTGCYAAYLTPQGRMISDLYVYELGDVMLVTVPRPQLRTVMEKFEQFIFSEDVRLGDASDSFVVVAIVGPTAADLVSHLAEIPANDLASMPEHGCRRGRFEGEPLIVTRITDAGEPGFDVYVETARAAALKAVIETANAPFLDADTAEVLRVEAGIPKFGADMDEQTIPLEAGIESRAISFSKGCYVGQEVIIRVLHRGHGRVVRKLVGLVIEGNVVPASGAAVAAADRTAGNVTSAVFSSSLKTPIALAYLHRDFIEPGTAVSIEGHPARVTTLPFAEGSAQ